MIFLPKVKPEDMVVNQQYLLHFDSCENYIVRVTPDGLGWLPYNNTDDYVHLFKGESDNEFYGPIQFGVSHGDKP